jgi:hypothetical protein
VLSGRGMTAATMTRVVEQTIDHAARRGWDALNDVLDPAFARARRRARRAGVS